MELMRLIADYNTLIEKLNKAEKADYSKYTDKQLNYLSLKIQELIKDASRFANMIEKKLGRPLVGDELLNGIN